MANRLTRQTPPDTIKLRTLVKLQSLHNFNLLTIDNDDLQMAIRPPFPA